MEVIFFGIFAVIILKMILNEKNKGLSAKLDAANQQLQQLGGQPVTYVKTVPTRTAKIEQLTPEMLEYQAESVRKAQEAILRQHAEGLMPQYEKSELVRDLVNTIGNCNKYGVIWDVRIADTEVIITTMTDMMESRYVFMEEHYDFSSMGYQDPIRESGHRLALALALQKRLGMDYGIEYNYQYNTSTQAYEMSGLNIGYRKKQEDHGGEMLKSPI